MRTGKSFPRNKSIVNIYAPAQFLPKGEAKLGAQTFLPPVFAEILKIRFGDAVILPHFLFYLFCTFLKIGFLLDIWRGCPTHPPLVWSMGCAK